MSKIDAIVGELNDRFAERDGEITCLLLAALSGEHAALIGQDAVDDDGVVKAVCECFENLAYNRYMVTSTTSPEDIENIPKNGMTVLDNVFNASGATINSILGMIDSGKGTLCAASREAPNEDDEMFPVYSSFILRNAVSGVDDPGSFLKKISSPSGKGTSVKIDVKDIETIRKKASSMSVDDQVLSAILSIRDAMTADGKVISDIRWKNAVDILKIAAASSGKDSVDSSLIPLLQHMLWDRPSERRNVRDVIFKMCTPKSVDLATLHDKADELLRQVVESKGAIDENAGFPRVVYCYDCDESFVNLRRLRNHNQTHPRHAFADPNNESDGKHSYKRYGYSDLVTLMTTRYKWEIFKDNDPEVKEKFRNDVADLRIANQEFEKSLVKDRDDLVKGIDGNPWLSQDDRDDLMEAFDRRSRSIDEIEDIISDAEAMME